MKRNVLLLAAMLTAPILANSGDYTVVEKDNLWNLSGEHLGDPTQWQRIWGENQQINNPDLIHPGDLIRIPNYIGQGRELGDAPINEPVTFSDRVSGLSSGNSQKLEPTSAPTSVTYSSNSSSNHKYLKNTSDLYSNVILRSSPYVLSEDDVSNDEIIPGMGNIEDASQQIYGLNTVVTVVADEGETFVKGERYDFSQSVKYMTHKDKSVNVVRPAGSGVVISTFSDSARIRIVEAWHIIRDGARVEPYRRFPQLSDPEVRTDVDAVEVNLLTRIEESVAVKPYEILILDAGQDMDLNPGDLMSGASIDSEGNVSREATMRGIVLNVNDNSASMIVQEVHNHTGETNFRFKRYGRLIFKQ